MSGDPTPGASRAAALAADDASAPPAPIPGDDPAAAGAADSHANGNAAPTTDTPDDCAEPADDDEVNVHDVDEETAEDRFSRPDGPIRAAASLPGRDDASADAVAADPGSGSDSGSDFGADSDRGPRSASGIAAGSDPDRGSGSGFGSDFEPEPEPESGDGSGSVLSSDSEFGSASDRGPGPASAIKDDVDHGNSSATFPAARPARVVDSAAASAPNISAAHAASTPAVSGADAGAAHAGASSAAFSGADTTRADGAAVGPPSPPSPAVPATPSPTTLGSAPAPAPIPAAARSWRTTFSSLKIPNYRLYFTGQSISLVGTWMQMTAQAWLVLMLTHSATALGLVTALQTLPVLLLGPYGGVIADRSDKLKLMTILQAVMGVQALVLGLLTVFHAVNFWEICLLAVFLGVNNAFENSPRQSFIREMVGMDQLRNAITLNSVTVNAARAVGPGIGGILIASVGVGVCFLINAVSFVAVVTSLLLMNRSLLRQSPPTPRAKGQLREGFHYAVRTRNIVVPLAMMALVGLLAYEFQVSLPVLAQRTFHGGSEVYGFMTASMGVGAVVGGLFTAARGRAGIRAMVIAATGFGCAILLCAYSPNLAVVYIGMLFAGWASVSFISIGNSTIQLAARPEMRGRVISLWQVAFQGTTPIGGPLVGWIIATSDPRTGLAVGGIACLVAAVGAVLYTRPRSKTGSPRALRLSGFGADAPQQEQEGDRSIGNRTGV